MNYPDKITEFLSIILFALIGFGVGNKISTVHSERSSIKEKINNNSQNSRSFRREKFISKKQNTLKKNDAYSLWEKKQNLNNNILNLLRENKIENWEKEWKKINEYCALSGTDESDTVLIFFSRWAEEDFQKALEYAGKMPGYALVIRTEIFSQLAETDPKKALEYYENNKSLLDTDFIITFSILNDISRSWAMKNPDEALAWGLSIKDGLNKAEILQNFMNSVGFKSEKAKEYLDKIYDKEGSLPHQIIVDWIATDPDSAMEWGNRLKEEEIPYWQEMVLAGTTKNDLDKATDLFLSMTDENRSRYISSILNNIEDSGTALSWLFSVVPLSQISETNLYRLGTWTYAAPEKAEKWIRDLSSSPAKDAAIEIYVKNMPDTQHYETVLSLLGNMENPVKKNKVLENSIKKWEKTNPDKFKNWRKTMSNAELIENLKSKK